MDQLQDSLLPLPLASESPLPPNPTKFSPRTFNTTTITASSCSSSSSPSTLLRLATVITLFVLTLWGNYEATKGFDLTVLSASTRTLAGRRFNLLFVSNGRASELALKASIVMERSLYPPQERFIKKSVHHVTIRLADRNLTEEVVVKHSDGYIEQGEYLIELSPSLMVKKNVKMAVESALHRGMAYVWLCENAPRYIIDAMVDYLMIKSGFAWKHYEEDTASAHTLASFIELCEERRHGFFASLNNAMQEKKWSDKMVNSVVFSSKSESMCLDRILSMFDKGLVVDNYGLSS